MTSREQAEMAELHLTAEQMEAKQAEITAKLAEPAPYEYPDASAPAKPTRARRSDAGKARAPKPPAVAPAPKGVLDVDKLEALIAAKEAAKDEWDDALDFAEAKERAYDNHSCNLNDYLDSLRG